MSRLLRLLAVLLLAVLVAPVGPAAAQEVDAAVDPDTEAEELFAELINASRAELGLDPLVVNVELAGIARAWSGQMDADDDLHHNPSYSQQYTGEWSRMGENVGTTTYPGASVETKVRRLHDAFMASPGHHRNIVGSYNQVGIGVVQDGAQLWVTVNFLEGPIPAAADEDFNSGPAEPEPVRPSYYVRG